MACVCGHSIEEHGGDPKHPGSMACTECDCIHFEKDDEEDEGIYALSRMEME